MFFVFFCGGGRGGGGLYFYLSCMAEIPWVRGRVGGMVAEGGGGNGGVGVAMEIQVYYDQVSVVLGGGGMGIRDF